MTLDTLLSKNRDAEVLSRLVAGFMTSALGQSEVTCSLTSAIPNVQCLTALAKEHHFIQELQKTFALPFAIERDFGQRPKVLRAESVGELFYNWINNPLLITPPPRYQFAEASRIIRDIGRRQNIFEVRFTGNPEAEIPGCNLVEADVINSFVHRVQNELQRPVSKRVITDFKKHRNSLKAKAKRQLVRLHEICQFPQIIEAQLLLLSTTGEEKYSIEYSDICLRRLTESLKNQHGLIWHFAQRSFTVESGHGYYLILAFNGIKDISLPDAIPHHWFEITKGSGVTACNPNPLNTRTAYDRVGDSIKTGNFLRLEEDNSFPNIHLQLEKIPRDRNKLSLLYANLRGL